MEQYKRTTEGWGEVKIVIPVLNAPLEIYYGYALDKEDGESEGRWHVGMWVGFKNNNTGGNNGFVSEKIAL